MGTVDLSKSDSGFIRTASAPVRIHPHVPPALFNQTGKGWSGTPGAQTTGVASLAWCPFVHEAAPGLGGHLANTIYRGPYARSLKSKGMKGRMRCPLLAKYSLGSGGYHSTIPHEIKGQGSGSQLKSPCRHGNWRHLLKVRKWKVLWETESRSISFHAQHELFIFTEPFLWANALIVKNQKRRASLEIWFPAVTQE